MQPIVVQKPSSQPIQQKPIVVPKPSFHLPLPKGFEHLGAKPENSEQKNGIGFAGSVSDNNQEKVRMLEARMTKKESPSEVDTSKTKSKNDSEDKEIILTKDNKDSTKSELPPTS